MAVTKKAIADYLGISRTAVSLALNNAQNSTLSEETKIKIQKAAKELGYREAIVSKKICFVLYNMVPNDPFNTVYLNKVEKLFGKYGYNMVYMNITLNTNDYDRLKEYLETGECEGMILTGDLDDNLIDYVEEIGIPYLAFGVLNRDNINNVTPDSEKAAYEATKFLIDKNHRKIALFSASLNSLIQKQTLKGYNRALEDYGIPFDKSLIQISEKADGYELASRMEVLEIEYTAAFCVNTVMQFGALQWLKDSHISVPKEVSLIGFGFTELVKLSNPQLTTMAFEVSHSAKLIVDQLISIIANNNKTRTRVYLSDLRLYEGGTVSEYK
jgi:Transcriptional regulators